MTTTIRKPVVDVTIIGNQIERLVPVRFIIHSTETHDRAGLSDITGVLTYLKNTGKSGKAGDDPLGVHFCIDAEGHLGQGGHARWLMYGAAGANTGSIHCELIGQARFIRARWVMRKKQLEKLARLMAWTSTRYDIPLRWDVHHGFLTHKMATDAFMNGQGHWDPGFGFPRWLVMRRAREIVKNHGWDKE